MEYDLKRMVLEILQEENQLNKKDRFTAEDIKERFGFKNIETARKKIRRGEFGPYINVGKHKVVTLQGVLDYEEKNTCEPCRKPIELRHNYRKPKTMPGRI